MAMRLGKREAERIPGTMASGPLWIGLGSSVSWQNASTCCRVKTCVVVRVVVCGVVCGVVVDDRAFEEDEDVTAIAVEVAKDEVIRS